MYSFIFDVDGTLIDSYDGICESTINVLNKYEYKMENVRDYILDKSVLDLFKDVSKKINVSSDLLYDEYKKEELNTIYNYKFMDNAIDLLRYLKNKNYLLFIYTHKSDVINKIINDNNLDGIFTEIISSDSDNFKRKPDPYCIEYLVNKYNLNKNNTYYVGDRKIDILCAKNAKIKSIALGKLDNSDIIINNFKEMKQLF